MTLRKDFYPVEAECSTILELAKDFERFIGYWINYKNSQDFNRIYQLSQHQQIELEQIYINCRTTASTISYDFSDINNTSRFPTWTSFINYIENQIPEYIKTDEEIIAEVKLHYNQLQNKNFTIGQMIKLSEEQVEILKSLENWINRAKSTELYQRENPSLKNQTDAMNTTSLQIIRNILQNFKNSITKITDKSVRYGGRNIIDIKDEYDVQDILYVILKSVFPNIKYEENTTSYGGSSNRLDFILESEGIIIEVKHISPTQKKEKEIIKQIKIDLESYHVIENLNTVVFFIYAPNAVKDTNSFYELEGERTKNNKTFNVQIILIH